MDTSGFTMPWLESLSTGELMKLANECGLDIPAGLDRVFIIEELLYLDRGTVQPDEVEEVTNDKFRAFAVLPGQYNISFIEALIRDPLWVFVFWEIKIHDRELCENAAGFEGYCLRVIPFKGDKPDEAAAFTVTVNMDDCARYLGFPPEEGPCFKVELCAQNSGKLIVLAASRLFRLPRLADMQTVSRNPLVQLSGVDHFSLIHSEDRLLRPRGI